MNVNGLKIHNQELNHAQPSYCTVTFVCLARELRCKILLNARLVPYIKDHCGIFPKDLLI